ncbi:mechanosensitive ion channel family protein [Motilibacter aurantiacus]|uniref:mechanosensitive ion channel family protein n=1 Tax=Motilibacter aurantiacus TaxID=2714955 RepID=UPI001409C4D1|nr:mechanosensitive ion channel family protein [Motilibacter aurantiacus]NHC47020.1 mechanosensitive ion channel family protein [Motilibacter aurantiacus]
MFDEGSLWRSLLVLATTGVAAAVAGWLSGQVVTRVPPPRYRGFARRVHEACHRAWVCTLVSFALLQALDAAPLPADDVQRVVRHALVIATIAAVSWLVVKVLFVAQDAAFTRLRVDVTDNRRVRKMRTQILIVRRITAAVVTAVGIGAILMSFDTMRTVGASLLASAGIAGAIAGFAAQATLGNVFAGIQLAFTDALRIDDVVVVEGEWGRIEELTLTYVVVHLWDERRLVLPTSWFTSNPFQNWTRKESRVLGAVQLHLDFATPLEELRRHARDVIEGSPLWDRRDWVLQVTDTTETTMVVRVLASAHDAPSAFDLRCDIREQLLTWLQRNHPYALPRTRAEIAPTAGSPFLVAYEGSGIEKGIEKEMDEGTPGRARSGA